VALLALAAPGKGKARDRQIELGDPQKIVAFSSPAEVHNASDRALPNSLSVWGTQMGYDAITYVINEFWPTSAAR
jgi:hypothetical protein